MSNDKISVIIPVYNIEEYLEKAIESIINQIYRDLEIIIVDDGSADMSGKIADELSDRDPRIIVIHQKNSGVTNARITGIKAASGDWIGFVDGDDYIEADMYQVLIDNAKQYQADISHCGYQMVFPNRIDYYHNTGQLLVQDTASGLRDLLEGIIVEPGLCNKLYNKKLFSCLNEDGVIDTTIKHYEDLLMNYYLFKNSQKSVFFDKCYYHYMIRKGSAATSDLNEHKLKDPLKVMKIIDEDITESSPLKDIIQEKIIRRLIHDSTVQIKNKDKSLIDYRKAAGKELKKSLPGVNNRDNRTLKIQAYWAGYWPSSYRFVHTVYGKMTGVSKKYEVE